MRRAPELAPARATAPPGRTLHQCPLCASLEFGYEFVVEGYPVCQCRRCELLFLNPQPADRRPTAAEVPASAVYEMDAANAAGRLRKLLAYAGGRPRRVLIVSNEDALAAETARGGLEVTALTSADVEQGGLAGLPAEAVDAAILHCALERLPNPQAALTEVRRVLASDGALMVIAPTVDSRTARLFRSAWWEFTRHNLLYFTVDTLQSLLIRCGYGDPRVERDAAMVSLEYFRQRLGAVPSTRYRRLLRLLARAAPRPLRVRGFRLLTSRTIVFARPRRVPAVPRLSVIVPAYNERATFRTLMDRLLAKSIEGLDIEVVLVESNSTDGTREEALRYGTHPRVTLILQDRPLGKGNAVRAGLAASTGDLVLFQDADLEYDLADYDELVQALLAYRRNFVIGSRHTAERRVWKIRQFNESTLVAPLFNLGHVVFLGLLNLLYRQHLSDPFSMFKVFRRECLYGLAFECDRFDFDFEIVIKFLRKGYRPLELPVSYRARAPSEGKKVRMLRDPVTWIRALVRYRWSPLYIDRPR